MVKIIELCGGIGAQHMAANKAFGKSNVKSFAYVEWDQKSVNQYNAIHHTSYKRADMQFVRGHHLSIKHNAKDIFIMFASTPCQSLSNEGLQEGMAPGSNFQSSLIWESVRMLKECKTLDPVHNSRMPHYFIIENVVGIHNKRNIDWFNVLLSNITDLGYDVKWFDLNGKDLGEVQMRNRCFVVCTLKGCGLPDYIPVSVPAKKDLISQTDLSNIRKSKIHKIFSQTSLSEIMAEKRIISDLSSNTLLQKAPYLKDVDLTQFAIINRDFSQSSKRVKLYTDRIPTILTSCGSLYVIDTYHNVYRRLTSWEVWQLMNFPKKAYDEAKKTSTMTSLYKTAGDSIMVNVLSKVLEQIPTNPPKTDVYPDVPTRKNGWLFRSKTAVYKKAYKTYNKLTGKNITPILPNRNQAEVAIFGLETKNRHNQAVAKGVDKTQEDLKLRRNIKKRITNQSTQKGAFLYLLLFYKNL